MRKIILCEIFCYQALLSKQEGKGAKSCGLPFIAISEKV
jgi:hypothetical protein